MQLLRLYLYGRGVDVKLLKDGERLLKELVADCDVCDIRSVVVIQSVYVLHHAGAVGFDCRQNEQILEVSEENRGCFNKQMANVIK